MSHKKQQPIKQALKIFYANQSLSNQQVAKLQKILQQDETVPANNKRKTLGVLKWMGAMAASLLMVVALMTYLQTPALITSAYADIYKDANLNNGMQASMRQWLTANKIADVPALFPVKMSKFCRLAGLVTTHLRIAGKQQGEMNVFFHHGDAELSWRNQSGKVDDMNWRLLKVRDDLTLIVLYTHDMREKSVNTILQAMLSELQA
ncbi:hypothetical protein MNBD_GAMMA08-1764 [hydrothermal vent metagenome]|uniref:DUF4367 domain-containing protein n=1 Tax=hydrothermal vent metagenome TaxID=652676 RepID=A0A3B0XSU0_9ZZZZ